jgi:hypothetical protein
MSTTHSDESDFPLNLVAILTYPINFNDKIKPKVYLDVAKNDNAAFHN